MSNPSFIISIVYKHRSLYYFTHDNNMSEYLVVGIAVIFKLSSWKSRLSSNNYTGWEDDNYL